MVFTFLHPLKTIVSCDSGEYMMREVPSSGFMWSVISLEPWENPAIILSCHQLRGCLI